MIHPQLCEEDGDRFLADFLQAKRPLVIAACAPNMQNKMFRDAFAAEGMDVKKDMTPLDIRDMTTDEAYREGGRRRCARMGGREGTRWLRQPSWACRGTRSPGLPPSTTTSATSAWSATSSARTGCSSAAKVTVKLVVANPNNCVVFCRACAKTCGPDAISFPDKPETVARIKKLREGAAVK